ncbi:hypothetical protein FQR65_LT01200 [Abscondita terminalis]|nr:hypothetical protein FQR65_LT01200 [Abscondita terminalis]
MDEQDLDKLFECFKKSESNRCGRRTSKDKLYYNKPNTGNCGCQNGIEQKPTRSLAIPPEETKEPSLETSNPILKPHIICKCGKKIPSILLEKINEPTPELPKLISKSGGNYISPKPENLIPKTTIECKCGENSIDLISSSAQQIKKPCSELIKQSVQCKCGRKNNSPVAQLSIQESVAKIKQDSLEVINKAFCSTCQNINSTKDDFQQNLKSLQNQLNATYRNIESVRDLNKDLKSGVCYLQNSLNSLKEGKNSLENLKINYNVEVKCACRQPEDTLHELKQPSIIKCGGIPVLQPTVSTAKATEKSLNFIDNSSFPCKRSETPSEILPSKESNSSMMHSAHGVTYSGAPKHEGTTETGTSIIDNLTKCAEQCRQYLDAISAAKTANSKALKIQDSEFDKIQKNKENLNISCGGTKMSNNVTEFAHKCQQYTNKANNASQVEDFKTTKSKFNAEVQCEWKINDQSTQYNEHLSNVNTKEAATGSDLKACTSKGVQCSNKINNAAQSEVFVKLKNNVEVQSTWDSKNQATQYDQISNAETEICTDLLKCTKSTITIQDETDLCNTCSIRESPKFASGQKDCTTQSIVITDLSSAPNKGIQCSNVKQNGTQVDDLYKSKKPTKDEATLAVNETKMVNKCDQCLTASETLTIVQDYDKKQCGWKKTHPTTQATEEIHSNKIPLLNMQNSVKSQTHSEEILQINKKDACLPCAKDRTQTNTGDKNLRSETQEIQQTFVATDKRLETCPRCLRKIDKPLISAETQSSWQIENKTTQSCNADNVEGTVINTRIECSRDPQFSNKNDNATRSEEKSCDRCDYNKNIAVQCHQKSQNASTQSTDKSTKPEHVKTGTSTPVAVDQCQEYSAKSNNITQTESFQSSSLKTQCALEAEDKITQAGVNVCRHCLNKLTETNINDFQGFSYQNDKRTQSVGDLRKSDTKKLSDQTNDDVNKYKCRECTNLAKYSAQTDSVKSLNIRKSVKSQTETRTSSDVDKGIQSSNKSDRGSQTDELLIPRLNVKIQTGNSNRKKSSAKRSSVTSQTSLKRLGSSTRTRTQKPMQSTSGILKNCNKNSPSLRKNNCAGSQTSPVSNYYLSSLNSNNKCEMNRNYCSSGSSSSHMCNSNCSRHMHNSSCYLP